MKLKFSQLACVFLIHVFSFSAYSSVMSYRGQSFDLQDAQCQQSAQAVAQKMQQLGLDVFDYGCQQGSFGQRVLVQYGHSFAMSLTQARESYSTQEQCLAQLEMASAGFAAIDSMHLVSAYCRNVMSNRHDLTLDFFRAKASLRRFDHPSEFTSKVSCDTEGQFLEHQLQGQQLDVVFYRCRGYVNQERYRLEVHYAKPLNKDFAILRGQKVQTQRQCLQQDESVVQQFSDAGLSLFGTFCLQHKGELYQGFYYSIHRGFFRMNTFKGLPQASGEQCRERLQNAQQLLAEKNNVIYSFCDEKKTPIIYYSRR